MVFLPVSIEGVWRLPWLLTRERLFVGCKTWGRQCDCYRRRRRRRIDFPSLLLLIGERTLLGCELMSDQTERKYTGHLFCVSFLYLSWSIQFMFLHGSCARKEGRIWRTRYDSIMYCVSCGVVVGRYLGQRPGRICKRPELNLFRFLPGGAMRTSEQSFCAELRAVKPAATSEIYKVKKYKNLLKGGEDVLLFSFVCRRFLTWIEKLALNVSGFGQNGFCK